MTSTQVEKALPYDNNSLSDQLFLSEGDWIIINYHSYTLFSQGFKTSQLSLKKANQSNIISSIFVVESYGRLESQEFRKTSKLVFYGQKLLFQHLLSGKYLSYSHHSSQEEVRLKYGKTGNCLFTIKPIFKCQASFGRKIRIGEQVCLQSLDRLKIYIEVGDKSQEEIECLVSMRKHQSSILLIDRLNSLYRKQEKISNLLVYQLLNIETQSELQLVKDKQDNFLPTFSKNINIYGSFITIEHVIEDNSHKQSVIQFNTEVFIKFYTTSLYLGFDQDNRVGLYNSKSENCIFLFEDYDKEDLKQNCTMKVKHCKSKLYLSLNKEKPALKEFSLINTFHLKKLQHNVLKITLLVNQIYQSFVFIVKENLIKNRMQFQQLIRELIKFIFPPTFNQQNYFKMNQIIKLKISSSEQILLAKVGFIDLIAQTIGDFISILNLNTPEGKTFYLEAISNLMLILVGICFKNQQNTEILIKFLPVIYEGLAYNTGIIEALYYLFSYSSSLRLFEKTDHRIKKGKIRSIQLLIDYLHKQQNWDINSKEKLFRLLQRLIKPKGEEKLLLHEFSLIRALKQNRLDKIWNQTKVIEEDIYVRIKDQFIQLQGFFQKKARYNREIDLIRAQFHFLCTLYSNPNSSNLAYFRTIFPQIALLNYLKTKIFAQQRKILLRILSQIYLKPLLISHNFLINIKNNQDLENINRFRDIDYRVLQKIKDQILETFKQGILNQIVDEALYMYIKAIRMFYELYMISDEDWTMLEELMQSYVLKNYNLVDKYKEVKRLVSQIIKSHQFSETITIYKYTKILIKLLHQQSKNPKCCNCSQTAEAALSQILNQPFFTRQQSKFAFLNNLIKYTLETDSQIFVKSCMLMKRFSQRSSLLLKNLKMVIIIDNQWYQNIVLEGKQLHQELKSLLMEFRKLQNQEESLMGINMSICKKIIEIKALLYRREKISETNKISSLMQNIIRQLSIHETVIIFIRDEQRQLRDKANYSIFFEMFDFLLLFFFNNFTNLNICIRQFALIRWLFTYENVGQSKILYLLVANSYSRQILGNQLRQTSLLCIKQSKLPNCFGVMSLISLMMNKGNADLECINYITSQIINDPSIIELIWKVDSRGFHFQCENDQGPQYFKDFGFYLFLVVKLFMVTIQYSNHEKEIIKLLKQKVQLKHVLKMFTWKDYLDQSEIEYFGSYLMKIQLIKYCQKLYDFEEVTNGELALYGQMCLIFTSKLSTCRTINELTYPDVTKMKNIYELQIESQKIRNDSNMITIQQTFHLIVITVFYPFLLLISQKLYQSSINQQDKAEIELIWLNSFRKIKQLMHSLSKPNYRKHMKKYNRAIMFIEEIIQFKINFQLQQVQEEFVTFKQVDYEQQRVYRVEKLHNIIDNCQILSKDGHHQNAVKIYKAILILMYSPQVKTLLDESTKLINHLQNVQTLNPIIETISRVFDEDLLQSSQAFDLIWIFIRKNPHIVHFICQADNHFPKHLNKLLLKNRKEDPFGNTFGKYLQICNYMMNAFLSSKHVLNQNIFQHSVQHVDLHENSCSFNKNLIEKIKITLKTEASIYCRIKFQSHLEHFQSSSSKINYQQLNSGFQINEILVFIANKLAISIDRSIYSSIVVEILLLIKVYVKFLVQFNLIYVPKELLTKIRLCLNIVYYAISPIDEKIIKILHEGNYHKQFQILLQLKDNWEICQYQTNRSTQQIMKNKAKQLHGWQAQWLELSSKLCLYSCDVYGTQITYEWATFPLQAAKSLFGPLQHSLLLVLKTLKSFNLPIANEILYQLSTQTISKNIIDLYYKHYHIFGRYTSASVNPSLVTYKNENIKRLAQTLCFQNGIILVSLLIFIQNQDEKGELEDNYIKHWQYLSSYGGFLADFMSFFADFRSLWISNHEKMISKLRIKKIYEYFYTKMARVQILQNNKLYSIDFIIRPQCIVHRATRSEFISSINFISTQVKLESILQKCKNLSISFDCFTQFANTFRKLSFIIFIQKYLSLIRALNILLLLANNIYLLINSNHNDLSFYDHFIITNTFEMITVVNLVLTGIFFIVYNIRNIPIIIAQANYQLEKQGLSRDYTPFKKNCFYLRKIVMNRQLIYHFIFLTLLFLVILNKLFVALLLLDLLIQIKRMKMILMTLWKAKSQIIYTFVSFMLLHYFYTIFVFLMYKDQAINDNYCDDFGDCYGFVYNLCLKLIGGFVGYIYQRQYNKINFQATFHFYDVLEDFYLIITYQIFIAVILVIIIDQYSKNTYKDAQLRENLSVNCIICGLSRTVFNTSTRGNFRTHISAQHNVWNYVFYYQYLNTKSIRDRNRLENSIIMKHTIQWLPNGYAKGFQQPSANSYE